MDEIFFHFIHDARQTVVCQFVRDFEPTLRHIPPDAAKAHIVAHHARTGGGLKQVEDEFAFL